MTTTATYSVQGMTCGHCAAAVTSELEQLPGVRLVEVDLASGAVAVTSEAPLDPGAVAGAIDEAGYELVGLEEAS